MLDSTTPGSKTSWKLVRNAFSIACKRCNDVCQAQIPIQQMWDQMRSLVIQEKGYHTFPGFEMMVSSFLRQSNVRAGAWEERGKWLPDDVKPLKKGKIAYWAGCTASSR